MFKEIVSLQLLTPGLVTVVATTSLQSMTRSSLVCSTINIKPKCLNCFRYYHWLQIDCIKMGSPAHPPIPKGSDLKPAIPTELSKHGYISANQSLRVNLRIHSHHQLFMLSNFCFMNSVLKCQISKVFASFFFCTESEQTKSSSV